MRKNLFQAAPEEEAEINLTPMLDVVFIMLIFFIVTASFVKESGLDVNRPDAPTAVKKENANILVAIGSNNEIVVFGVICSSVSVRANIERMHAENPEGSVIIQADKKAFTETLVTVMDAARQAGVFNVSIAAEED